MAFAEIELGAVDIEQKDSAGARDRRSAVAAMVGPARRLALALTGSVDEAEDLAQTTIMSVLGQLDKIKGPLENYLRRAMVNQFKDGQRKTIRRRAALPRLRLSALHPDIAQRATDRLDLERALAHLEVTARAVVVLRFLEDLSVEEVAGILERPAGTVRRITHEALAILRAQGVLGDISQ